MAVKNRMAVPALPINRFACFAGIIPPLPFMTNLLAFESSLMGIPNAFKLDAIYLVSSLKSALVIVDSPSANAAVISARFV